MQIIQCLLLQLFVPWQISFHICITTPTFIETLLCMLQTDMYRRQECPAPRLSAGINSQNRRNVAENYVDILVT